MAVLPEGLGEAGWVLSNSASGGVEAIGEVGGLGALGKIGVKGVLGVSGAVGEICDSGVVEEVEAVQRNAEEDEEEEL